VAALTYEEVASSLAELLGTGDPADPATRKRLRIIEAATSVFLKHGYRKASVDVIAREAGVAKGTVYLYFKSKAELLVQAVVVEKSRFFEALKPILAPEVSPPERVRAYLRQALPLLLRMPLTSMLVSGNREVLAVFEELDAEAVSRYRSSQLDFTTGLLEPLAQRHHWTDDELSERARVLLGLVYALGNFADEQERNGLSVARFSEVFANLIVDGLLGPNSGCAGGGAR
jgi:AcrR family transcriptional regulator